MGVLFTLTPDVKAITQQALDDLITELGSNCLLIYPPISVQCGCLGNVWETGNKIPLGNATPCSLCGGTGFREEAKTELIKVSIATDPANFWQKISVAVQVPAGMIQVKSYATDVVKIRQARKMQVRPESDALTRAIYILEGEPVDVSNIIQSRYYISTWKREQ